MTDHDLRLGQQRGKAVGITLIIDDRGLQLRRHVGKNARCDGRGKMA
jgi:hypothetical protein